MGVSTTRPKWDCEDLRKSKLDILLNTLLLIFLVVSYIPQISLILSHRSTFGISQTYILFNYLFTASQFAMVLYWTTIGYRTIECIADNKLRGLEAYGAILGQVHMAVLWLGSALLVVLFFYFPNTAPYQAEAHSSVSTAVSQDRHRYPRTILFLCLLHTTMWVLPMLYISIPRPPPGIFEDWHNGIILGVWGFYLTSACFWLVIAQFPLQIKLILSSKDTIRESTLSLATLGMQTVAFLLLGLSWKIRLRQHPLNLPPPDITPLRAQYRLGGWQYMNNTIFGIGQGILLLLSLWMLGQKRKSGDSNQWKVDERTLLFGAELGEIISAQR